MKRIKIIEVPRYETDPKVIVEYITKFLTKVRKDKVAGDLIGDDERSEQFDAKDFDFFGDELSNGVELTSQDVRRITARANRLAKERVAAAGISHLKSDEYDRLKPSLNGMQIVMAKDQNWADEIASKLHTSMPWMGRATEYAWHALRRSAQRGEPVLMRRMIPRGFVTTRLLRWYPLQRRHTVGLRYRCALTASLRAIVAGLRAFHSPSPSALIPVLSIRRFNGPALPRQGRLTFSAFCWRQRVLKSGTDQLCPTNCSKL